MTLTCIAIDDEPLALAKLENFIKQIPFVELTQTFASCIDAVPYLSSHTPDILFLDIQMDHMTGIQLLESIAIQPHVVIISAFEQYALKGFQLNVTDYLLKPYGIGRLIQAIDKVRRLKEANKAETPSNNDYIFVKTDYRIVRVATNEILFVEGMGDYLCLHTVKEKILTSLTFKELLALLPANSFLRVHKSYVMNLAFIDSVEKHRIYIGDQVIPISQTYRALFYQAINRHP